MITRGHDMPFGTKLSDRGATFRLWARRARALST
jgi:hypothetical protein